MKRKLKVLSVALCFALAFSAVPVSADTADKTYHFYLGQSAWYTSGYYKDNESSVYVNPVTAPADRILYAGFRYTSSGSWVNETIGQWAYIAAGTKRRLRTNIFENAGYQRVLCRLGGKLETSLPETQSIYTSGYWSPDTAGSYPAAN